MIAMSNSYLLEILFPKLIIRVKYMPLPNAVIFRCLTLNLLWQSLCLSLLRPDCLLNSSYLETNLGSGQFFLKLNLCQLHEQLCLQTAALLQIYMQFVSHRFHKQQKGFICEKVRISQSIRLWSILA